MAMTQPEQANSLPEFYVVGFTGHRMVPDSALLLASLDRALDEILQLADGEWLAVSSAAVGGDLLFAQLVLRRLIAWQALLPFPQNDFATDFTGDEWAMATRLLNQAETITVLNLEEPREQAYLDCGIETVNRSDVLLAVWDGEPARGPGGTAQVIRYARELRKPLVVIDPSSGIIRRENFERFCAKDPELFFLNRVPDASRASSPAGSRELVARFQDKVDRAASHGAPRIRFLRAAVVVLHTMATSVAAAGLAFGWQPMVVSWGKLLLLLAAFGAALKIQRSRAQHHWMRCRLAAEIGRAVLATWTMPRRRSLFEGREVPGLRQYMRTLDILHRRSPADREPNLDAFCQRYRRDRIEDQLHYYTRRLDHARPRLTWLRFGFTATSLLAIGCTGLFAVHATVSGMQVPEWVVAAVFHFLPLVLPALAAALLALISINDLHRRVARYSDMCVQLTDLRQQITLTHTWHTLESVVQQTERILIQEVLEWHIMSSHSEGH